MVILFLLFVIYVRMNEEIIVSIFMGLALYRFFTDFYVALVERQPEFMCLGRVLLVIAFVIRLFMLTLAGWGLYWSIVWIKRFPFDVVGQWMVS